MGSLKRKMARSQAKKTKKAEKKMAKQLMMFDLLTDSCAACDAPFDKDSKIALNYEGLDPSVNTSLVAEKDTDFSSSQTEIVTIPAGDTTAVVILTAIDDNIQDPNERIVITLNNQSNYLPFFL